MLDLILLSSKDLFLLVIQIPWWLSIYVFRVTQNISIYHFTIQENKYTKL